MLYTTLPHRDFSLFVFDKDGTLTPPNQPMTEEFAQVFRVFVSKKRCVILTARDMDNCIRQIIEPLGEVDYTHLEFACSNGSEIYRHMGGEWRLISQIGGSIESIRAVLPQAIEILSRELGHPVTFEFRSSGMGAFVCLPRDSSHTAREAFDPTRERRYGCIALIAHLFPLEYEIIPGGSTSIDVSLSSKRAGMEHILSEHQSDPSDVVFFGDSFDNGNDAPVLEIDGITCIQVSDPSDTESHLLTLLSDYEKNKL